MQLCVGTSLAIIVPTSLRSFLAHRAKGNLPVEIIRRWAPSVIAGIVAGGVIAAFAPSWVFKLAFVVVTSLIAMRMLFGNESWRLGDTLPGPALMAVYGFIIGFYSAVMGVGGGSVSTLVLMLYGTADPRGGRHFRRDRRADLHPRHHRLHDSPAGRSRR